MEFVIGEFPRFGFGFDGITTRYEYDAAGRLVKEGDKTYTYGYLDKVLSVTDGAKNYSYSYHPDGQLATANYGSTSESFGWDGLALIQRGDEQFVNEPHVGGGNPVASSKKATYFNDLLGTTVGQKTGNTYTAAALTAFGEPLPNAQPSTPNAQPFFTGKPQVEGLGYAFLMRNYRAGLAKWQTADPMGYPDGWNQLAYCGNGVTDAVDLWGCAAHNVTDNSWAGWGPYVSESGAQASFRVYAHGTCSDDYKSLSITACGVSASEGSSVSSFSFYKYDGKVGSLDFYCVEKGTSVSKTTMDKFSDRKIVWADVTVDLTLVFTYEEEIDGENEPITHKIVVKSDQHVFHLECSAQKPFTE